MKKIFLLEDDSTLGELVTEKLKKSGYEITWADSFSRGLELLKANSNFDLALLDIGLPDGHGFDFAQEMQKINFQIPFLFLTAQADADNRLKGYELGAHEFIPKPFFFQELIMRIEHVLKEYKPSDVYKLEQTEVRVSELLVIQLNSQIKTTLTHNEMKVLELLIKNSPKVIHRDQVMNEVWGENKDINFRTIDNIIVKLRQALGDEGVKLKTVRGIGYQFLN